MTDAIAFLYPRALHWSLVLAYAVARTWSLSVIGWLWLCCCEVEAWAHTQVAFPSFSGEVLGVITGDLSDLLPSSPLSVKSLSSSTWVFEVMCFVGDLLKVIVAFDEIASVLSIVVEVCSSTLCSDACFWSLVLIFASFLTAFSSTLHSSLPKVYCSKSTSFPSDRHLLNHSESTKYTSSGILFTPKHFFSLSIFNFLSTNTCVVELSKFLWRIPPCLSSCFAKMDARVFPRPTSTITALTPERLSESFCFFLSSFSGEDSRFFDIAFSVFVYVILEQFE